MYALASLLLPAAVLAAPTILSTGAADAQCTPTSYTLSDYTIQFIPGADTIVDFTVTSAYTDKSIVTDAVQNTIDCLVSSLETSSNACTIQPLTLTFDLRGNETSYAYELLHEWSCNGATWHAATAIQFENVTCQDTSNGRVCHAPTLTVQPENVLKECAGPTGC